MEGAGNSMPESSPGPHDRQDDAYDRGDCLPWHPPAGRGSYGTGEGGTLFWNSGDVSKRQVFRSAAPICPGAEAFPTAPKVSADPNTSPHSRLITPVPAIDIVMMGRSAYSEAISSVAQSSVSTSFLFCGITAIFGISAPSSCIPVSYTHLSDCTDQK